MLLESLQYDISFVFKSNLDRIVESQLFDPCLFTRIDDLIPCVLFSQLFRFYVLPNQLASLLGLFFLFRFMLYGNFVHFEIIIYFQDELAIGTLDFILLFSHHALILAK